MVTRFKTFALGIILTGCATSYPADGSDSLPLLGNSNQPPVSLKVSAGPDLVMSALQEYGKTEINNPEEVIEYAQTCGLEQITSTQVPWCATFVCFLLHQVQQAGQAPVQYPALARSWLDTGTAVTTPQLGDLVIFSRPGPRGNEGHVGLFIRREGEKIFVLGGNQNNQVSIRAYRADRLLGYRRIYIKG